jgi:hypothetical protein
MTIFEVLKLTLFRNGFKKSVKIKKRKSVSVT